MNSTKIKKGEIKPANREKKVQKLKEKIKMAQSHIRNMMVYTKQ